MLKVHEDTGLFVMIVKFVSTSGIHGSVNVHKNWRRRQR